MGANIFFSFLAFVNVSSVVLLTKSQLTFLRDVMEELLSQVQHKREMVFKGERGVKQDVMFMYTPVFSYRHFRYIPDLVSLVLFFPSFLSFACANQLGVPPPPPPSTCLTPMYYSLYTFLATDKTTFLHFLLIFTRFYFF
jgi:hypothetical protein